MKNTPTRPAAPAMAAPDLHALETLNPLLPRAVCVDHLRRLRDVNCGLCSVGVGDVLLDHVRLRDGCGRC